MGALVETQNITNTKYINDMRRVCLADSSRGFQRERAVSEF